MMKRVNDSDIPTGLADRLDNIMFQRLEEERRRIQEKNFRDVRYITETELKNFHGFKRDADFIAFEAFSTIKIMDGSTYTRLFLSLSERWGLFF
jgi:ribosomal protein RSM22 (predicted rRNA methylase)